MLHLTSQQWHTLLAHLQAHLPEEAGGLLAGRSGVVHQVYCLENIEHSPVAYLLDPHQQVQAMVEIEMNGWELCGIFHSHPAGPPQPSPTDVAQAYYPEAIYLVCAPDADGQWQGQGFTIVAGSVTAVPFTIS